MGKRFLSIIISPGSKAEKARSLYKNIYRKTENISQIFFTSQLHTSGIFQDTRKSPSQAGDAEEAEGAVSRRGQGGRCTPRPGRSLTIQTSERRWSAGFRKCLVSGHTTTPLPYSHFCDPYLWSVKVPEENVVSASECTLCSSNLCQRQKLQRNIVLQFNLF